MSWSKHVKHLQRYVAERHADENLDTVGILRIVQSNEMRQVIVSALTEDERKLSFEIVQLLCRAAEQGRCAWKRESLKTVFDHCQHAIDAFEYQVEVS